MLRIHRTSYAAWRVVVTLVVLAAAAGARGQEGNSAASYLRVVDAEDGTIQLQVAVRTLYPPAVKEGQPGPTVYVAGAVHIADAPFYEALQEFLDSRDAVLFEGVKPAGAGDGAGIASDEERVHQTKQRLRFLASAAAMHRAEHGAPPDSMDALSATTDRRLGGLVGTSRADGWGHDIELALLPDGKARRSPGVDFVSLGADGKPGGDGVDADLRFSDQRALSPEERGEGDPGIQEQLASALGLVFQKEGMDWGKPNWRNSDLSVDEIMARLDPGGGGPDGGGGEALFSLLQGGTFMGKLAGVALKFVGMSETFRTTAKLMVVEMLSEADALLEATPGMERLMEVILHDRNAVVVEDLRRLIRDEPEVRTVGIIYGAGHLRDLEQRICEELGYTPGEDQWRAAITIDLKRAGITPEQAKGMRTMVQKTIREQIAAAKKLNKGAKKK